MNPIQTPINGNNNFMDLIKSQMMTMFMVKNINGTGTSDSGITGTIYLLVITQVIEFIMRYLPVVSSFIYTTYITQRFDKYKNKINTVVTANNIVKIKKSSITLTIRVGDQDNIVGQALMDYVTNCKNTTHVSYKNKNFMLNQRDVIEIYSDVYAIMTQSSDSGSDYQSNLTSSSSSSASSQMPTQLLEIYSFEKTVDELRLFLENIKQNYVLSQKNKLGNTKCYFNMISKQAIKMMGANGTPKKDYSRLPQQMSFTMKRFSTNRKFTNLFGEDIETIKSRVHFFINNRNWYNEKGIPYSLGLLLSGAPGTGKTSTIKCLANETGRHIFNINLNNDITKQQLENLFFNEIVQLEAGEPFCIPLDQRIYVLEDIDCQSDIVKQRANTSNTQNDDSTGQIDLSFLLNLLDGVLEMPGRIVIMTSNFPDSLDTALIRPGRIDIIAKFTNCSYNTIVQMLEFFYDTSLTDADRERIRLTEEYKITPAEMSRIMFENFNNLDGAICKYLDYFAKIKEIRFDNILNTTIKNNELEQSLIGLEPSKIELEPSKIGLKPSKIGLELEKMNMDLSKMESKLSEMELHKPNTENLSSVLQEIVYNPVKANEINDFLMAEYKQANSIKNIPNYESLMNQIHSELPLEIVQKSKYDFKPMSNNDNMSTYESAYKPINAF